MHIDDTSRHYTTAGGGQRTTRCLLLRRSYRDESGKPRNETLANLSALPDNAIAALRLALMPIRDRPLPRFPDDADAAKLMSAARDVPDLFDRVCVEVLARTALRKGEFLAREVPSWQDQVRLIDATPVPCGTSRETVKRSELAGWAAYGYCAAHSRLGG